MNEDIIFKRRNRLKKHFVNTSNVLLYCYETISDAAKTTFQVIDSFDWEDKETGDSKGYVYPAIATLALFRHTSERTIRRHVKELEDAGLLTRKRRRNKPSVLYIEEVSQQEIDTYFALINQQTAKPVVNRSLQSADKIPASGIHFNSQEELQEYIATVTREKEAVKAEENPLDPLQARTDKNVRSESLRERTKMSVAYNTKTNEQKENEMNVNENFKSSANKPDSLRNILSHYDMDNHLVPKLTSRKKKTNGKPDDIIKRDYFAQEIADALSDQASLGCYRVIAHKVPEAVIFQTLATVKEAWAEGKIKKSRGALFVDIMKTYCQSHAINLQFTQTIAGERGN